MEALKILFAAIVLSIFYGICHDLVTANISIEYFTIGHPRLIESESPWELAVLWGVIATWWVGLILGLAIAFTARIGKRPKLKLSQILKPMLGLIGIMAGCAIIAGGIGYILAKQEVFTLVDSLAQQIDPKKHHLYLTAGWAHGASYLAGIIGGILLCFKLWRMRKFTTPKKINSESTARTFYESTN